jgi:colicin import membrane protein
VPPRQEKESPEEEWRPEGLAPDEDSDAAGGSTEGDEPDTDEWVVPVADSGQAAPPNPTIERESDSPGVKPKPKASKPPAAAEPKGSAAARSDDVELGALRERLDAAERRAKLAERRVEEAATREEEASKRVEEATKREEEAARRAQQAAEREKAAADREEEAAKREEKRPEPPKSQPPRRPARSRKRAPMPAAFNGGVLDINSVRFEDLRSMGLTVAQSARIIAIRDVRNGFESLKELDDLDDLSQDLISMLKQRLSV